MFFPTSLKHGSLVHNPNILLLTATITPPPDVPLLRRTDPAVRLDDYVSALKFYLSLVGQCVDYILFVENSNSDISKLKTVVEQANLSESVEFLVFDGLDYPTTYGRGYGEFKLVEYAMNHSITINNQPKESVVWKVTGRYFIRNLCRVIVNKPSNFDVYCNFRNLPPCWADMYLVAWTIQGYQAGLKNIYQEIKDIRGNRTPETHFRKALEQRHETVKIVPRFKVTPRFDGVHGLTNQKFSSKKYFLLKYYVRSVARRIIPWLWI